MIDTNKYLKAALASYGRSILSAVLTLLLSGYSDWKAFAFALVAAVIPVAIRALNPNDPAFGKIDLSAIEAAIQKAVADALAAAQKKADAVKAKPTVTPKKASVASVKRTTK